MAAVARQSSPRLALVTSDLPSARLEIMSARWVMDLSPGTSRVPRRGAEAGEVRHRRLIDMDRCLLVYSSFINSSSLDICFASLHPVTQAHERPGQGFCPLGTGYDELQTPLATLGGVDDTKVFDVGSELAGGRRDLGEHSRAVGHHQGKAYGLTPVVGLGEDVEAVTSMISSQHWDELRSWLDRSRRARLDVFAKPDYGGEPVGLTLMVPDRPGVLAEVTTAAGQLGANIEDLRIVHSTEGGQGRLELVVSGAERAESLVGALMGLGYRVERSEADI